MRPDPETGMTLQEQLELGIPVFDGAMGTVLYGHGISLSHCFDELNVTRPDLVRAVHQAYRKAGATILETNTFGANRFRLAESNQSDRVAEFNAAAVALAREVAGTDLLVAGSIGPVGKHIEPIGTVHPDDGEAPVVTWESDFTGPVEYSYILTENNNNAAASPGYQLFFWDDSASLLTLLAKDDLLGNAVGDLFASESVFGNQAVAPGDMLLMAIDDGGNGSGNDRTIVQAYITRSAGAEVIPEPSTFLIWSLGLLGLAWYRRRRTK